MTTEDSATLSRGFLNIKTRVRIKAAELHARDCPLVCKEASIECMQGIKGKSAVSIPYMCFDCVDVKKDQKPNISFWGTKKTERG